MEKLRIAYMPVSSLTFRQRNPRTHSSQQIAQLARSIETFGFVSPVLIDNKNVIVVGHARTIAAKKCGLKSVPTVKVDHLSQNQIKAYVIADNRLAERAGWDRELLALEFQELDDLGIDLTITGFDAPEIDLLLQQSGDSAGCGDDEISDVDRSEPAISQLGDLWKIGKHFVFCGSALELKSFHTLMGSKKAQLIFTDAPYNVAIEGHVSGLGKKAHREFAMASGEMSSRQFTQFLRTVFGHMVSFAADGSIHYLCMDWRHMGELLDASTGLYSELKNLCVWAKTNAGMGSLYRSQHELIFVFKKGTKPHVNNVELGKFGRNRTNLWTYAGANTFGVNRDEDLAMHPTVKPLKLVADAILDCSSRGGLVLDPFLGSGTTLVAAERTGRSGYGIEIDPYFVDTAIRRLTDTFGLTAIHAASGKTFEFLKSRQAKEKKHDAKTSKNV